MNTQEIIKKGNMYTLLAAMIWHLNNVDDQGNPTTTMSIPNGVYDVLDKKIQQLPKDRVLSEYEMLDLVRKK